MSVVGDDVGKEMVCVDFSLQWIVANISPHRMYEVICGKHAFLISFRQTPLHLAAYFGKKECVEMLLLHGADTSLKNVCNLAKEFESEHFIVRVNHWRICE